MIQRIEASNFKCFKDISLEMSNLNLLSGINSMGKSTIIQMLLLLTVIISRIMSRNIFL